MLNDAVALTPKSAAPGLGLAGLAIGHAVVKRWLSALSCSPAGLDAIAELKHRAAGYQVKGPLVDAQARTHDCWRVGHVREAHRVLDRMNDRVTEWDDRPRDHRGVAISRRDTRDQSATVS
ncbi:hypothetical protein [Salinisphaera sp. T31B1]|uniref:hypothetical protein n=1 Tax=Salinisphaera sp. T31B1 TaxID=727963 RepID=UPI00333E9EE8